VIVMRLRGDEHVSTLAPVVDDAGGDEEAVATATPATESDELPAANADE